MARLPQNHPYHEDEKLSEKDGAEGMSIIGQQVRDVRRRVTQKTRQDIFYISLFNVSTSCYL